MPSAKSTGDLIRLRYAVLREEQVRRQHRLHQGAEVVAAVAELLRQRPSSSGVGARLADEEAVELARR